MVMLMPSEIIPLLYIGNRDESIHFQGAVIDCLFTEGELREEILEGLLEKIHRYRGQGIPVMAACENGIDRSPTVVMHYLVRKVGMSQDEAIKLIKQKRPVANPHPEWQIKKSVKIVEDKIIEKQKHSFLWYDTGLSVDHAIQLGKQGHAVHYFVEYRTRYPKIEDFLPGYGFKEINKVFDYGEVLDSVETIVFVDVGFGSLADLLRKKGYAVFGASAKGELLELDRIFMLREFEKLGIDVPKHQIVRGVDNLFNVVGSGDKFVKLNIFRGNFETMYVKTPSELKVDLEFGNFGVILEDMDFIVTEPLKGVEVGIDTLFNGKEFLRPLNEGNEVKGTGAQFNRYADSSEVWDGVLEKLAPWLAKTGYRGALSLEGIYDGSKISVIDVTARLFFPGSSIYPAVLENYADVIYAVARGEYVKPRFSHKYYSLVTVSRTNADKWTKINFSPELAWKSVFIPRGAVFMNGEYWSCPGDSIVATIVGRGNTFDESIAELEAVSDKVKGRDCDVGIEGIYRYKKDYLTELKELGIVW